MSASSSRLQLNLLGPPIVLVDGAPLNVDTRKAVALLSYLAVTGSSPGRDEVAALLWPEAAPDKARSALRRTLSSLRAGLSDRWVGADRYRVFLDREGLGLDLEVAEATSHTDHGHPEIQACPDCIAPLSEAARLHRGTFMEGFSLRDAPDFDNWVGEVGGDQSRRLRRVLERLSVAHAAAADFRAAAAAARRRIGLDQLDEGAHRHLMLAHAYLGERAEAIDAYRACLQALETELGVPPLEETTELYEAILDEDLPRFPGVRSVKRTIEATRSLALVGREAEVDRCLDALEADGTRGVFIDGPMGIGKSRLIEELPSAARAPALTGRGHESERDLAYGVAGQLIEAAGAPPSSLPGWVIEEVGRLVPAIGGSGRQQPKLGAADSERRLVDAVARFLTAALPEGLVCVDDVQWMDHASTMVLSQLLRKGPTLILAGRSSEIPADGALHSLVRNEGVDHLTLGPLEPPAALELYANATGKRLAPDVLMSKTGGIPLYLTVDLEEDAAYRFVLLRKLRRLSQLSGQVLSVAAIADGPFGLDWLRSVAGRSEEEILEALEVLIPEGLLGQSTDGQLEIPHEQVAAVAREGLTMVRRRVLHRRAAAIAAGEPGLRGMAAAARHYQLAGMDEQAAEHAFAAGEMSIAVFALDEAEEHLRSALALGHPHPERIHIHLGEIAAARGHYGEALRHFEAAAARLDGAALADVERQIGVVFHRLGQWDLARAAYRRSESGEPTSSRLYSDWALLEMRLGDRSSAVELASRAEEVSTSPDERSRALNIRGLLEEDPSRAITFFLETLETGDAVDRIAVLNNLGRAHEQLGELAAAADYTERALEAAVTVGRRHREAALRNRMADLHHRLGEEEKAREYLRQAVSLLAEMGTEPGALEPEIWLLDVW